MAIKGLHGFRYCILENDDAAGFEYEKKLKIDRCEKYKG